ncbi:hypothetical protein PILCRDRAFT_828412 [Piloderma croceum F 1598]|uniref:Uncharacterized protein n=1 Tax=Piloderma croceum (strain F 1598) TaxID=765440 RepID=A0A0C3AK53_PILCF|nr:hypothetical protein PILCRDRAFT_828412 [Piloderma croceum F 1598]
MWAFTRSMVADGGINANRHAVRRKELDSIVILGKPPGQSRLAALMTHGRETQLEHKMGQEYIGVQQLGARAWYTSKCKIALIICSGMGGRILSVVVMDGRIIDVYISF